jgi:uncharacterized membrane protein YozB (DUF420 family)
VTRTPEMGMDSSFRIEAKNRRILLLSSWLLSFSKSLRERDEVKVTNTVFVYRFLNFYLYYSSIFFNNTFDLSTIFSFNYLMVL